MCFKKGVLAITHINDWTRSHSRMNENGDIYESFEYQIHKQSAINIQGYRLLVAIPEYYEEDSSLFTADEQTYEILRPGPGNNSHLSITVNGVTVATFSFVEHLKKLHPKYDRNNVALQSSEMLLNDGEWSLLLRSISYNLENGNISDVSFSGWLLRR